MKNYEYQSPSIEGAPDIKRFDFDQQRMLIKLIVKTGEEYSEGGNKFDILQEKIFKLEQVSEEEWRW